MTKSSRILSSPSWQGLGAIISIVGVVASIFIAYDIYRRSAQFSSLVIEREYYFFPIDIGSTPSQNISMVVDGTTVKSVAVYSFALENNGRNPIVPSDYVEPIQISSQEPWRILTIENATSFPESIKSDWTKVTTDTYEMKPMLLNPGDRVRVLVFITNFKDVMSTLNKIPEPTWSARIVNVPKLEVQDTANQQEKSSLGPFYFSVSFRGWGLYVFALFSIGWFLLSLELHNRFRRTPIHTRRYRVIVLAIFCLSLASGEASLIFTYPNTYIFVWASYPLIILHLVLLMYLVWPALMRTRLPPTHDVDLLAELLRKRH